MSSEYLQRIISDFALREQARHQSKSSAYSTASKKDVASQYLHQTPTLLLTPPSSDAESDESVRALNPPDCSELSIMSGLSDMAKKEQISILLDRKKMLEAYLQSLATDGPQLPDQSTHPKGEMQAAESISCGRLKTLKSRIHKPYKLPRVRRVRVSVKDSRLLQVSPPLQVAFVNYVQVQQGDINRLEGTGTDDEEEEELVFQAYPRANPRSVSRAIFETSAFPSSASNLKDRQAELLRLQFAHLVKNGPSTGSNQPQSLYSTPRLNHATISRQLRETRLKTAIDADNNPIRYPRGQVVKPSILQPYLGLDMSDEDASDEIAPVILPPPRAEILDRIESVAKSLQESFPLESELLEPYIQNPEQGLSMVDVDLPGGPHGDVFWDNGVGKLRLDQTVRETIPIGKVHIFMDHSNVFLSWKATIQENPPVGLPPTSRMIMSLPILSLILQRGRPVHSKGMHLAGSSPLMQSFDPAIKLGWECSILKRVPAGGVMHDLKRGAIDDIKQTRQSSHSHNRKHPIVHSHDFADQVSTNLLIPSSVGPAITTTTSGYDTISSSETEAEASARVVNALPAQSPKNRASVARYSKGSPADMYRQKEQAVDELLHLKILQTILSGRGKRPGTIVLATGDARGGQYNEHGFLGCVREAITRGWHVELWAFQNGMSRSWIDCAKKEGWIKTGRFAVWNLDHWLKELTQVI